MFQNIQEGVRWPWVPFIDKIRTYRTQTPYTFFGHKAFTAISYPGDGGISQPTGYVYLSFDFLSTVITREVFFCPDKIEFFYDNLVVCGVNLPKRNQIRV
jgi:hypothetical protein